MSVGLRSIAMVAVSRQDEVNRRTWSKPSNHEYFDRRSGFLQGEDVPFEHARRCLAPGAAILELGVGLGRTIGFTSALTNDYRAIDYVPAMVDACRARHPGVRVDLGDARTLDGVPDGHFGLVTFAWNGIDAVTHADRARVLRTVRRVLAPGGLFFFSTLNMDGPDRRTRPWHLDGFPPTRNLIVAARRALWTARYVTRGLVNWARLLPATESGSGYQVAPLAAHDFGLLVHYTSLPRQIDELESAGFGSTRAFAADTGASLSCGDDTSAITYFHLVTTASSR